MNGIDDLHRSFTAPDDAALDDRTAFLRTVDAVPEFARMRADMRRLAPPPAGGILVDAGCGPGFETARLAADLPEVTVVGLDHDRAALAAADARDRRPNLRWRHADLASGLDLPPRSVDVVRTERVLMYLPDLDAAVAAVAGLLVEGGMLAAFELDYGATVLATAGHPPERIRRIARCLEDALPQPWAGRSVPDACVAAGLEVLEVRPYAFTVPLVAWTRIVGDTVRAARAGGRLEDPGTDDWLRTVERPEHPGLRCAFTGVLTVARRGARQGHADGS